MIRTAIKRALATAGMATAVLAICAAPSLARLEQYKSVARFGSPGSGAGQFESPIGVASDEGTGDVYVVDQGNNRVERFEADGKYLSEFNGSETPAKAFEEPTSIAVDNSGDAAKGHVYVADPSQSVVDVFDASGKYLSQIHVEALTAIATDLAGHLWTVTDQISFEEYDETGALMLRHSIEREATPSIAVDSRGNVYLVHSNDEEMSRYSPPEFLEDNESKVSNGFTLAIDLATDNIFQDDVFDITLWPPFGEGPGLWQQIQERLTGEFGDSRGLAVNGKTGELYVSDRTAGDVEAFRGIVAPDLQTGPASKVTIGSATIEGTVNPDKKETSYFFEWGETETYGNVTAQESGEGNLPVPVSADISGLESHKTYHYRIVASNESGTFHGADETFTTPSVPPVIEGALHSSNPTRSSVVLSARINPNLKPTSYHFVFVEEAAYRPGATDPYDSGGLSSPVAIEASSGGQSVERVINGLRPDTTYHFNIIAQSEDGVATGADGTFTTGGVSPPLAVTGGSDAVAQNTATIGGVVSTNDLPTSYGFEIGTSTDYGPPTGLGSVGAGLDEATVSLALSGLQPGTTYHYRLTATNLDGTSYGADQTFTTGVFPSTFATPPASLPFVAAPLFSFPPESTATVKQTIAKKKTKKRSKKRRKAKTKRKAKTNKKK